MRNSKALLAYRSGLHIGLFRLSALGDVTLLSGAITALRDAYPDARITWIIARPCDALLQGMDGVEFVVIDKPRSFSTWWRLLRTLRQYRFDALLCMQASLRAHLIFSFLHAPIKLGFDSGRAKDGHRWFVRQSIDWAEEHLADAFMRFVAKLSGRPQARPCWNLPIAASDHADAALLLPDTSAPIATVALVLATTKAERDWPLENYLCLCARLQAWRPMRFVILGGTAQEATAAAAVMQKYPDAVINLVGRTPLKTLAAVLAKVDCLVAPDTGSTHIANAMGCPVVGLYAVARSALSGPYDNRQWVVDRYSEAVLRYLGKPCSQAGWHERVHHRDVMSLVDVDSVFAQCQMLLAGKNNL